MANFGKLLLTNVGMEMQYKAQAGTPLKFKRFGMGSGLYTGNVAALTSLVGEVVSVDVSKGYMKNNAYTVEGFFSNDNLTTGFAWREIGLFVEDEDGSEVLYCYANAGDTYDYIPSTEDERYSKYIRIVTAIGNAANVSIINGEGFIYVDLYTFNSEIEAIRNEIAESKNYTDEHISDTMLHLSVEEKQKLSGDTIINLCDIGYGIGKSLYLSELEDGYYTYRIESDDLFEFAVYGWRGASEYFYMTSGESFIINTDRTSYIDSGCYPIRNITWFNRNGEITLYQLQFTNENTRPYGEPSFTKVNEFAFKGDIIMKPLNIYNSYYITEMEDGFYYRGVDKESMPFVLYTSRDSSNRGDTGIWLSPGDIFVLSTDPYSWTLTSPPEYTTRIGRLIISNGITQYTFNNMNTPGSETVTLSNSTVTTSGLNSRFKTGSYTGNGSATSRTISLPNTSNMVMISSDSGMALVTNRGAICKTSNSSTVTGLPHQDVLYSASQLTISSTSDYLNKNGQTYWYQVL